MAILHSNGILEVTSIPLHTPTGNQATIARLTNTNTLWLWNGSAWIEYTASSTEGIQDIVGTLITDTATIDSVYNDGAGTLELNVKTASIGSTQLDNSGVVAGIYTYPTITFDADGRATNATNKFGVYRVLITQVEGDPPTVTELENTTNKTFIWTITETAGEYRVTPSTAFDPLKTYYDILARGRKDDSLPNMYSASLDVSNNYITIRSYYDTGTLVQGNELLINHPFEIIIY